MPLGERESFEDGRDRAPSQDSITSMALGRANYEAISRWAAAHQSRDDGRDDRRDRARSRDFMALARANYSAIVSGLKPPRLLRHRDAAPNSRYGAPAETETNLLQEQPRDRRVWGVATIQVATIQARPSPTANERPRSVLLAANGGSSMVEAAPDSSHGASEETAPTTHSFPGQPRADDRPVRGVVTIQARDSSPTASERPRSVLLVANAGSLMVDELRQPHTRLLELPLEHVAAQAVPGRDNMFHIGVSPPGTAQSASAIGSEGFVVVLRDRRLRDQWLQALESVGARVDAAGWNPAADAAAKTSMKPPGGRVFLDCGRPPVRWLR
jgi:hypothetical protein